MSKRKRPSVPLFRPARAFRTDPALGKDSLLYKYLDRMEKIREKGKGKRRAKRPAKEAA